MNIVYFTHSLASCWNHGNAHFLRGVLRALASAGHEVIAREPANAWSFANLLADHGPAGLDAFRKNYPDLRGTAFPPDADLAELCEGADLVLMHEWNEPELVAALGRLRRTQPFTLLFHDTHHRAVSDSDAIRAFDLSGYDGVLAFGETLAAVYRRWGWGDRVWVWHEAADVTLFHPPALETDRENLVWIGNFGDGERTEELENFLLAPAAASRLPLDIFGVRYPKNALEMLARHGAHYRGWLPNARAPEIFARHLATVHVPRKFYVTTLPGIPTIRVFEALACGIPLVSAPWDDCEQLFRPGDFLSARDGTEMTRHLIALRNDPALRHTLTQAGLRTILARHTCTHRARELLAIVASLRVPATEAAVA